MSALTGWGQADDKHKAHAAGFDRHLTKPVDPDRVHELIRLISNRGGFEGQANTLRSVPII